MRDANGILSIGESTLRLVGNVAGALQMWRDKVNAEFLDLKNNQSPAASNLLLATLILFTVRRYQQLENICFSSVFNFD